MIYILAGTNRSDSKTSDVVRIIEASYKNKKIPAEIMNLEVLNDVNIDSLYGAKTISPLKEMVGKLNTAQGIHLVVPEYNGGMPGVLKYFIDHFEYPKTFEWRPVCFVGLGGRFGGLRPVEHAQQIFGYRNGFQYPQRVFIQNVEKAMVDGKTSDQFLLKLLDEQVEGFAKFILALEGQGLDANSVNKAKGQL